MGDSPEARVSLALSILGSAPGRDPIAVLDEVRLALCGASVAEIGHARRATASVCCSEGSAA